MKNLHKGFAIPLLIAVIALLVVGGSVYTYKNKKIETPVSRAPQNSDSISRIEILSPSGGEIWTERSPQTIRWVSSGPDAPRYVEISLMRKLPSDTQFWNINTIARNQAGAGTFVWTVSPLDSAREKIANAQYKIMVSQNGQRGNELVAESETFTITGIVDQSSNDSWTVGNFMDYPKDVFVTPPVDGTRNGPTFTFPATYFSNYSGITSAVIKTYGKCGGESPVSNITILGKNFYKSPDSQTYVLPGACDMYFVLNINPTPATDTNLGAVKNLRSIFSLMVESYVKKLVN